MIGGAGDAEEPRSTRDLWLAVSTRSTGTPADTLVTSPACCAVLTGRSLEIWGARLALEVWLVNGPWSDRLSECACVSLLAGAV